MDGWTLRLIAAAVLTLSGAAAGRSMASMRRLRVKQLSSLASALRRLEIHMLERLEPLAAALQSAKDPALAAIAARLDSALSVKGAWVNARDDLRARGGPLACLEKEELSALDRLFDALGTSGRAEQRLLIGSVLEELHRIEEVARRQADEQAKLYTSLGLLTGLAVSILLL